jgi:hypothetical protein
MSSSPAMLHNLVTLLVFSSIEILAIEQDLLV